MVGCGGGGGGGGDGGDGSDGGGQWKARQYNFNTVLSKAWTPAAVHFSQAYTLWSHSCCHDALRVFTALKESTKTECDYLNGWIKKKTVT